MKVDLVHLFKQNRDEICDMPIAIYPLIAHLDCSSALKVAYYLTGPIRKRLFKGAVWPGPKG